MLTDRKNQHLDVILAGKGGSQSIKTGFERIAFVHSALPELDLDAIDLSAAFFGKRLHAPLLISSMTGGPARAAEINRNLAIASSELGIALAVGSQRVAIEGSDAGGLGKELRRLAPNIPLLGNFGAAQLNKGFGVDEARRAVEMIEADALIIHINPLQEAVQPEGDRDWRGLLSKIGAIARQLDVPLVVKEVGAGISGALAQRLINEGVSAIDVAGAGGTSWASVEASRITDPSRAAIAKAFTDWGRPTAEALVEVRAACPDAFVIGSGGIRDGIDCAKAIRLGANIVGQAAGALAAAMQSPEAVIEHFTIMIEQLRICCFCTGSRDLATLGQAPLVGRVLN
jgi:isopentenyl-diphosphate delta-isomerase